MKILRVGVAICAASLMVVGCGKDAPRSTGSSAPPSSSGSAPSAAGPDYDLVVYGGTPSGVMAAITASDRRMKVLLISNRESISGMVGNGISATDTNFRPAIGGHADAFFDKVDGLFDGPFLRHTPPWAEAEFDGMLDRRSIPSLREAQLVSVEKAGNEITAVVLTDRRITASYFIDASYEGDLMAKAGVDYTVGRESRDTYGESLAGVRPPKVKFASRGEARRMEPGRFVLPEQEIVLGAGDNRVMAPTYRLCLTDDPSIGVPVEAPEGYDPADFEYLIKSINSLGNRPARTRELNDNGGFRSGFYYLVRLPGNLFDQNAASPYGAVNLPGVFDDYPDATPERRVEIEAELRYYVQGLIYTLQNGVGMDGTLGQGLAEAYSKFHLCKGVFKGKHWPDQPYLREARRMVGDFVLTQNDMYETREKEDSIFIGSYQIDLKNSRQYIAENNSRLMLEGGVYALPPLYEVPYRILLPKQNQARNLLVTGTPSVSHVAWGSLRLEPELMMSGQTAAIAVELAKLDDTAVQEINRRDLRRELRGDGLLPNLIDICAKGVVPVGSYNYLREVRGFDVEFCALKDIPAPE